MQQGAIATVLAEQDGAVAEGPGPDLRQVWAQIADPRDRRGRRHSLVVILALVQAAVVAGATSFAAIRDWIGAAPQQVLADIGARQRRSTGKYQAPHPRHRVPLLDRLPDLRNMVISADMMHTQHEHARYLHRRGAYFVLPAGGNQPALFDQLDALAWAEIPIAWMTYDRGHGRQEIRTIQVRPAIKFPHVKQVFLVERHVYDPHWKPLSGQAVLGVTSLPAHRADPQQLAALVRGEWAIENRDHYGSDVTLGEDRCRVRTGALPSILAVMRSHTIGALRLLGFTNIAEGTRWA